MKIDSSTLNKLDIQSTGGATKKMKLGHRSNAMIFKMFTGGLYSNPIGSVIREITSNCFDAHVEAGTNTVKNPVVVEITKEVSGHFIYFRDKGVGMSPNRFDDIFTIYFETTKDDTDGLIGGFGLGGKTPLAYTSSFFIITRYDGIEYTYLVYEGNQEPEYDLLSKVETDEPNGTDVKVPIKESDIPEFEKKTLRQLYYFENIVFKGYSDNYVTNDYTIIKTKNFLYRGTQYSNKMHVCYGKVAYPIDYEVMDLDPYQYRIPVAIRLEIGDLEENGVVPSREAIKYTKNNIKIIKDKMNQVIADIKNMLGKQYDNVETLYDYYKAKENFGILELSKGCYINVKEVVNKDEFTFPNFKYDGLLIPPQDMVLELFYEKKLYGKPYPKRRWRKSEKWSGSLSTLPSFNNIYYLNDSEFNRKVVKQAYLKTVASTENFYIIKPYNLESNDVVYDILKKFGVVPSDDDDPTLFKPRMDVAKARKLIRTMSKELHEIVKEHAQGCYDDVVVPEDFIVARKKERLSDDILKTTIPLKSNGYRERLSMKVLRNFKGRIYYGYKEDEYTLNNARRIFERISGVGNVAMVYALGSSYYSERSERFGTLFVQISKTNEKYMKMLGKKAFHVDYFYQTYVSRKVDALVSSKLYLKYDRIVQDNVLQLFFSNNFKHINEEVYDSAIKISKYVDSLCNRENQFVMNLIDNYKMISKLNIDMNTIEPVFKYEKELNNLIKLTDKNKNRLKWFSFPHEIDPSREDHKELIEMVNLMFEK